MSPDLPPTASALEPAGRQADHIARVWTAFFTVAVVVTVLVVGFEIAALAIGLRRRRRAGEADPLASDPRQDRRLTRVVIAATALTVMTLIGLLFVSVGAGRALAAARRDPAGPGAVPLVRITGHRWWWQIEYDDGRPGDLVATANELHLPVGLPVEIALGSTDVVHSLWIPNLHGKTDLIPGRDNHTVIEADRAGVYRGQCAEFCGLEHARMAITVVAEPPDRFARWLVAQRAPAAPPGGGRAMHGQSLFLHGTCAMCHTIAGTGAGGAVGPDLTHVASRSSIAAGTLANDPAHLRRWVHDPQAVKPGVVMPDSALSPADLDDVAAYLETLR